MVGIALLCLFTEQYSFAIVSECLCICQSACKIALHHAIAYPIPKKLINFQKPCAKRRGAKIDMCTQGCWVNGWNCTVLLFSLNNIALLFYQSACAYAKVQCRIALHYAFAYTIPKNLSKLKNRAQNGRVRKQTSLRMGVG